MNHHVMRGALVAALLLGMPGMLEAARRAPAAQTKTYHPADKLVRGITNIITAPLEFPRRLRQRVHGDNTVRGWSLGTSLGLGYTVVRLAAGAYEVLTFPAAAPKNYAPVLEPEYVWEEQASR